MTAVTVCRGHQSRQRALYAECFQEMQETGTFAMNHSVLSAQSSLGTTSLLLRPSMTMLSTLRRQTLPRGMKSCPIPSSLEMLSSSSGKQTQEDLQTKRWVQIEKKKMNEDQ